MTDNLFNLADRVAIVTGGGDGIGRECCHLLGAVGAKVVVSDLSLDKARRVVDEISDYGGVAAATACDVSQPEQLRALVDFALSTFGTINVLVNNVGLGGGGRENPFDIDIDYVRRIYSINVFAPWQLSKLVEPYMARSGYGSIVNISSMSSINTSPAMAIYGSSKAALNHLSANLACDFGPMGVRINCVGPGAVMTNALRSVLTPEIKQRMLAHTPLKRLGEVTDIARAVLFFASPASAWITGQTLMVNGGGVQTLD